MVGRNSCASDVTNTVISNHFYLRPWDLTFANQWFTRHDSAVLNLRMAPTSKVTSRIFSPLPAAAANVSTGTHFSELRRYSLRMAVVQWTRVVAGASTANALCWSMAELIQACRASVVNGRGAIATFQAPRGYRKSAPSVLVSRQVSRPFAKFCSGSFPWGATGRSAIFEFPKFTITGIRDRCEEQDIDTATADSDEMLPSDRSPSPGKSVALCR
jgi:hypothetical protein